MQNQKLVHIIRILLLLILIVVILVYAKPFLVPLTFAALFSMLLLPFGRWLESKGMSRTWSTLLSLLVLLLSFAVIIAFISWRISDLASQAANIEQQVSDKAMEVQKYITDKLGISPQKQRQMVKEQQSAVPGKMSAAITGLLAGFGSFLADFILVMVYIFLFLFFRKRLKLFFIKMVPRGEEDNTMHIINNAQQVAQKYLTGLSLMIVALWIMYGIGFSIAGVKSAMFFAVLCGMLEIIPFVGNLVGTSLTVGVSLVQGGDMNLVLGILITYGLVQFIQTYILEPLVVGAEVNINPLFTIIGLVAGELLWGIPGMILAIPLLGIAKIVCDNIEPLKPIGFLIGGEVKKENQGFIKKVKTWFKKSRKVDKE